MRLKEFKIIYGFLSRTFEFNNNYNLIHSTQNSVGKTTLLRAILYALGFNIPNTKNFKFEECKFELSIITDSNQEFIIKRRDSYCYLQNIKDNIEKYFSKDIDFCIKYLISKNIIKETANDSYIYIEQKVSNDVSISDYYIKKQKNKFKEIKLKK